MKLTKFLSPQEYQDLVDFGMKTEGYYSNDKRLFTPGMGWYETWVYNPSEESVVKNKHVMIRSKDAPNAGYLSTYYWRDWADKRPPICIVGPTGETWGIDHKSSNGNGWTVTGEWPNITCSPSIVLTGYHGYLTNGEFTPDLERRN
jgi:hypothetical protein